MCEYEALYNGHVNLLCNYVTRRMENDVTQRSIQISANQPTQIKQVRHNVTANVQSDLHSFPSSNATFAPLIDSVVDRCH